MAITVVFTVPDMSGSQYEGIMRDLAASGQGAPDGRLYHVASRDGAGFLVVDVWESEEKLGRFADLLMPIVARNGVTPPQPRLYPAHNVIAG